MSNNTLAVFNPWQAKISLFVKPLKTIEVKDETSQLNAQSQLREAAALAKGIEECRKTAKEPHLQAGKLIDAHAKQLTTDLEAGITHLKSELRSFEIVLAKKRAEELKAAEAAKKEKEEAAKLEAARNVTPPDDEWSDFFGDAHAIITPEAKLEQATAEAKQSSELALIAHEHEVQTRKIQQQKVAGARKFWTFEIKDPLLVPRNFLMVDEKKITAVMREAIREGTVADLKIDGVHFFEDVEIRAGRF